MNAGFLFCCGDFILILRRAEETTHGGLWCIPGGGP